MTEVTAIVIAIAVLAVVGAIALSHMLRHYDVLLGPDNISDMSAKLAGLKRSANGDQVLTAVPGELPADLRTVTSKGMALIYTVSTDANRYSHHLSVSCAGQPIAHSAAMTLAAWMAYCLDVPAGRITVPPFSGNGCVRHVQFEFDKNEQDAFASTQVKVLQKDQIGKDLWKRVMEQRAQIETNSLAASSLVSPAVEAQPRTKPEVG